MFEGVEILEHGGTDAGLLHVAGGVSVLGIDEGAGLGAFRVLEPVIAVDDFGSEVIIGDCGSFDGRRRGESDSLTAVYGLRQDGRAETERSTKSPQIPHVISPADRIRECAVEGTAAWHQYEQNLRSLQREHISR